MNTEVISEGDGYWIHISAILGDNYGGGSRCIIRAGPYEYKQTAETHESQLAHALRINVDHAYEEGYRKGLSQGHSEKGTDDARSSKTGG